MAGRVAFANGESKGIQVVVRRALLTYIIRVDQLNGVLVDIILVVFHTHHFDFLKRVIGDNRYLVGIPDNKRIS